MAPPPVGDPLRVVFVSSHSRNGGSERYLETLLAELGPAWVELVVCLEEGPLVERLRATYPIEVVRTSGRATSVLAAARRLRSLLRDRPDLVHANGVKAAVVAVLATLGLRVPVVWVKHDFSWDGLLASAVCARCSLVVGVSEAVTAALRSRSHVRVVPTGIPPLPPPAHRPAGLPDDPTELVGVVGYLHPVKGQAELVEAAPAVLAARPGAHFLVVGGEDRSAEGYASAIRARVDELGISSAFTFLGHRDDAIDLVRACTIVTVPTIGRGEGFGLVGVEALAAGTPVVGYAAGALREVVGDCGLLVTAGDRRALAEAISRVLGDARLRERMSTCGRERAQECFGLERWRDAMVEAYREAA